jgi:hypothetical protein
MFLSKQRLIEFGYVWPMKVAASQSMTRILISPSSRNHKNIAGVQIDVDYPTRMEFLDQGVQGITKGVIRPLIDQYSHDESFSEEIVEDKTSTLATWFYPFQFPIS